MSASQVIPVSESMARAARLDKATYDALVHQAETEPETFWAEQAQRIDWFTPFSKIKDVSFYGDVHIRWFYDGTLNACYNCVDRHAAKRGDATAIIWEGDEPDQHKDISFAELKAEVSRLANALKTQGVQKGDRVTIYMPMIPEAVYAMLACARIGAIHSVVFGGFSPDALRDRIKDCASKLVITADEGVRGGAKIPLKANTDTALEACPEVETVLIARRTGGGPAWTAGRDVALDTAMARESAECPCEEMNAEDPLFILYTSGSTGKPKGVLHTTGGYMVWTSLTHEWVFDYHPGQVYWCTADVGWITGHSYIVYGPLANGATTLVFEGTPTYPDASRHWQVVDKHQVNIYYTAPTAIRALMKLGEEPVKTTDRSSLRVLGTVGEPINPEAWRWYYEVVGDGRCAVVDTWWQTETGGILVSPLPGATDLKPGSATKPLPGIQPEIVDNDGQALTGAARGNFCLRDSWPGQMRTVYGNHKRFVETYFSPFPGRYFSGDGAERDSDGYYWIIGRVDDVLNVSGHRLGTAEIENALVAHEAVAEAAVVGYPHDVKGEGIYCYVTLKVGYEGSDALAQALRDEVRRRIGPVAKPDLIQVAPGLPKTRSGKIMRRILRKIAANDYGDLGDTTTLADPSVVEDLIAHRQNRG